MNYLYYFGAVLMITVVLTCLFWGLLVILQEWRYRRAIHRRVKEIDLEMKKRGGFNA